MSCGIPGIEFIAGQASAELFDGTRVPRLADVGQAWPELRTVTLRLFWHQRRATIVLLGKPSESCLVFNRLLLLGARGERKILPEDYSTSLALKLEGI